MSYTEHNEGGVPFKVWDGGGIVPMEANAILQVAQVSRLPIVKGVALMADGHVGIGATVGSVVASYKAIIPAAVGVDIGCGMCAIRTSLTSHQISDNGKDLEAAIYKAVPCGFDKNGRDGNWGNIPDHVSRAWSEMEPGYRKIVDKNGKTSSKNAACQLGTLGSGNHFVSCNIDQDDRVWLMLHSGSRGAGNRIGQFFITKAKEEMERLDRKLPNKDLAYLEEGTENFADYVEAVSWAQAYARTSRDLMLDAAVKALRKTIPLKVTLDETAINCHHNYVNAEQHGGEDVLVTRKGAVSAREGEMGIIPGCMGGISYIVKGKGNPESFYSCSHGAGRVMARGVAKKTITLEMHREAMKNCVGRMDKDVLDESRAAYKDITAVMAAQDDLVSIVHTLQEVVSCKG